MSVAFSSWWSTYCVFYKASRSNIINAPPAPIFIGGEIQFDHQARVRGASLARFPSSHIVSKRPCVCVCDALSWSQSALLANCRRTSVAGSENKSKRRRRAAWLATRKFNKSEIALKHTKHNDDGEFCLSHPVCVYFLRCASWRSLPIWMNTKTKAANVFGISMLSPFLKTIYALIYS